MRRPGIVRECEHPGQPHKHGYECYRFDGCRCRIGRAHHAAEMAQRRKMQALGLHQPHMIDAVGSRRRIQVLMKLGYTAAELGRQSGLSRHAIYTLLEDDRKMRRSHADAIARLYNQLWHTPAPDSQGAKYVRRLAAKRGYLPAMAWDEDSIDDPEAQPSLIAKPVRADAPFAERAERGRIMLSVGGMPKTEVARRANLGYKTVQKLAKRVNEEAA